MPEGPAVRPQRILLAPQEIGGQMQLLAESFRRLGQEATAVGYFAGRGGLSYANDVAFGIDPRRPGARQLLALASFVPGAIGHFDVFHFFFAQSLVPRLQWDLPILRGMGKKVFVHFRGGDIADRDAEGTEVTAHEKGSRRIRKWRRYADRMFVSTPDLLSLVPDALLVPQAIDLARWAFRAGEGAERRDGPVRVLHAPSNRARKGTAEIVAAVERIRADGLAIDLVLVENMKPTEVARVYEGCDIAVDQLRIGWYGNFAVEMMALGKPVIARIDPAFPAEPDLPIISADSASIEAVLRQMIEARASWPALGAAGRRYVERIHSADEIARKLLRIYEGTGARQHRPGKRIIVKGTDS